MAQKEIMDEANSIVLDLEFIMFVSYWFFRNGRKPFNHNPFVIRDGIYDEFHELLKRNNIQAIKTNEEEVMDIVISKVKNNWLFISLNSQ